MGNGAPSCHYGVQCLADMQCNFVQATTIPLAALGFAGGIMYFGSQEIDPTKTIFGVDPMIFYGFATVACAGANCTTFYK